MPVVAGTRFGPYEIQTQLGAGGMGGVYRARDARLDRTVAIKILAAQPEWNPDGQELYYMDLTFNVLSVTVKESGGALQFGPPQMLVNGTHWSAPEDFFDVIPDGKKFLLNRIMQQVAQSVTVVTNFAGESKEQVNP